jgi:hypothetical protein
MLKNSLAKMLPLRVAVIGGALEYVNRIASCDGDTTTSATPATPASSISSTTTFSLPLTSSKDDTKYKKSLQPYYPHETKLRKQWEKDEEGFRNLPARAWPPHQPNIEDIPNLEKQLMEECPLVKKQSTKKCQDLKFLLATAYVFNNFSETADGDENRINHKRGYDMYVEESETHPDSMCAAGILNVEGLGRDVCEEVGLKFLNRAYSEHKHAQSMYELGTAHYTGLEGYLEEDEDLAFQFFLEASELDHYGAMYMVADCLMEGIGAAIDIERAIPLLFVAADSGHRFARQKCRELFTKYPVQ